MLVSLDELLNDKDFGELFNLIFPKTIKDMPRDNVIIIPYLIGFNSVEITGTEVRKEFNKRMLNEFLRKPNVSAVTYFTTLFNTQNLLFYNWLKYLVSRENFNQIDYERYFK